MSRSKPSRLRRAGSWVVNLVLVVTTLACLAWLAPTLFGLERYVITGGSSTVQIGYQPAARARDATAHAGVITAGCATVLIGG